jgi:hypothetical protein
VSDLTKAVLMSGAIDSGMLQELSKWKLPIDTVEDKPYESPEEVIAAIEEALTGADQVELRTTDLDILKQYFRTCRPGKLVLNTEGGNGEIDIRFGVSSMGEYIIPWNADSIVEFILDKESYLLDVRRKVFMSEVQELYFGPDKVFMLCTPDKERYVKSGNKN